MSKPPKIKLLERTKPKKLKQYHGFFRTTDVYEGGKMKTFPHTKDPEDGSKLEPRFRAEFRGHARKDATITQLINERAQGLIRRGKIKLVPGSFQTGPRGGNPAKWSAYRPNSGIDDFLSKSTSAADKKRAYLDIMSQLGYMHSYAQVAHLDLLKSRDSNIIMWDDGKPHFSDFGIAEDLRSKKGGFSRNAKGLMLDDLAAVVLLFRKHLKNDADIAKGIDNYARILKKAPSSDYLRRKKIFAELTVPRIMERARQSYQYRFRY